MPHDTSLVRDFIRGCPTYQRNKTEHLHPTGLLQLLVVPSTLWSDIAMDFVEGFPKVAGKSVIWWSDSPNTTTSSLSTTPIL
jgi:hypothetical protein